MEFFKKNARAIIIALLVVGVIVALSSSNDETKDTAKDNTSATTSEQVQKEDSSDQEENKDSGNKDQSTAEEATSNNDAEAATSEQETQQNSEQESSESVDTEVLVENDNYTASARRADNQTVLVRRILTAYESESEDKLTPSQRIYVETNLVNNLPRNDLIQVGATVSLSKQDIESRVASAKALDQATLDRWTVYL